MSHKPDSVFLRGLSTTTTIAAAAVAAVVPAPGIGGERLKFKYARTPAAAVDTLAPARASTAVYSLHLFISIWFISKQKGV